MPTAKRSRWPFWLPLGVLLVGIATTAVLAVISRNNYTSNEKRILELRVHDAGSLVTSAIPATETTLASAAVLAEATRGDVQRFMTFITPFTTGPRKQFASVSLWRLDEVARGPLAVVGLQPEVSAAEAPSFFARVAASRQLTVDDLLQAHTPAIGFGYRAPGAGTRYAVYAETLLPASRRSKYQSNSAFSDLDYAIFVGDSTRPRDLLVTDLGRLPVPSPNVKDVIPFGDSALTLVMDARVPLAGSLPRELPWIVVIAGVILTLGAVGLTVRLIQRQQHTEQLAVSLERTASENRRLYAEQRNISRTLQHALLPERLPGIPGAETTGRYSPGEPGVEVGGDWYDVIPLDPGRLLLVVGDVSGRGLPAATTMASLRFAIHAYAAQNDPATTILSKLSGLLNVASSGQLATVLCALIDVDAHELTVTSAGHLPPLLINGDDAEYVESEVGLPIGVQDHASYASKTVSVSSGATLIAFTDGLVERRGENLDQGLARLRAAAGHNHASLEELLDRLLEELRSGSAQDDTAIVGVRWTS